MLKAAAYKIPDYVVDKVYTLIDLLKKEKNTYETAASKIDNRQLRDTVSVLAQENNQYSMELLSQLRILGKESISLTEQVVVIKKSNAAEENEHGYSENILSLCKDSEKRLIQAYRNLLNEPFLLDEMRKLVRVQLNGILYAFLRLKLSCNA